MSPHLAGVLLALLLMPIVLAKCWLLTKGLGENGRLTYQWAVWQYGADARFDNTWLTWATDYVVTALCFLLAFRLRRIVPTPSPMRERTFWLLVLYGASTGIGGLAHQMHDGTPSALNRWAFRAAWTLVVGVTAAAGAVLGSLAGTMAQVEQGSFRRRTSPPTPARVDWVQHGARRNCGATTVAGGWGETPVVLRGWTIPTLLRRHYRGSSPDPSVPCKGEHGHGLPTFTYLPEATWLTWGAVLLLIVALGGFSCQRPACDVFLAGASQALPSFYLQVCMLPLKRFLPPVQWLILEASFLGNAPLIFAYPWLVQRSGLSLGEINAILHGVLAVSWALQGISLTRVCKIAAQGRAIEGTRGRDAPAAHHEVPAHGLKSELS